MTRMSTWLICPAINCTIWVQWKNSMPALSFGRSHARVEFHGLSQELLCNGLNNKKSQRKSAVVYEGLICSAQIPKTSKDIYSYSQGTTRGFPTRGALGMRARAKKTGDGTDIGSIDEFDSSYRIVGRICGTNTRHWLRPSPLETRFMLTNLLWSENNSCIEESLFITQIQELGNVKPHTCMIMHWHACCISNQVFWYKSALVVIKGLCKRASLSGSGI